MKSKHHLLIALICWIFIIYEYIYNFEIITHPYMFFLLITLFGVAGWNLGVGVGKMVNELRTNKK